MLGKTVTAMLSGMEGIMINVECDVSEGLPGFYLVGYLGSEVKEGKERIQAALKNAGYHLPAKKITMNLTPAGIHKSGTGFDLAMAVALAVGNGFCRDKWLADFVLIGELYLNGEIGAVRGVLPMLLTAQKRGYSYALVPRRNAEEACLVKGIKVLVADDLSQVIAILNKDELSEEEFHYHSGKGNAFAEKSGRIPDFAGVKGQELVKRACEVAVSGRHNLLLVGPPGTGKSMLAHAMAGIMPPLSYEEQLEVTSVYSISGLLNSSKELINERPFRMPHHKTTPKGLLGGGNPIRPGEISLANRGILFLDELPEFGAETLEVLRQPLEEGVVQISRANSSVSFPADVTLIAAMNPCPCGYYPDFSRCHCNHSQISRYLGKISGPLLDRFDMCVEVPQVDFQCLKDGTASESSESIRKRVCESHRIQAQRFEKDGILFNGQMKAAQIERCCRLTPKMESYMKSQYDKHRLTARSYHRILKVARTIADMKGQENIEMADLLEAFCYREDISGWK